MVPMVGFVSSISTKLTFEPCQGTDLFLLDGLCTTLRIPDAVVDKASAYLGNALIRRFSSFYPNIDVVLLKGSAFGQFLVPVDLPGTRYHKARVARDALREQLTQIIEERRIALRNGRASAEQDLLSFFLCNRSAEEERGLTDDEIKVNIIVLLYAGHDTSSSTLTSLFKFLAENPHCYDRVLQEQLEIASSKEEGEFLEWKDLQRMKYTWKVVQETLRLLPSVPGAFRKTIKDFIYSGFTIPKGWKVHSNRIKDIS
ncbi:hypothetical protein SUGI_0951260 [Cryptomeria japonica]|nr:hypothetical protein SUGI_0951260 [Cryptomeria japonica]